MNQPIPKALPHNLQAEQALLGILLYDAPAFKRLDGAVKADQFYEPFHQRLFGVIEARNLRGQLVDPLVVIDQFVDDPAYQALGGVEYLGDMVDRAPPSANIVFYAETIADLATRRALVLLADQLKVEAVRLDEGGGGADRVIAEVEAALGKLANGTMAADAWQGMPSLCQVIDDKVKGLRKASYVTTGYPLLDSRIGGLRKGRVTIIAGRPGMGKSTVGLEMARQIVRQGLGVGFFSLEMDDEELALRMACGEAYDTTYGEGPVYFDIQRDKPGQGDNEALMLAKSRMFSLPYHFDDRSKLTPRKIVPAAKRLIRKWERDKIPPGALFVDHLHIVKPDAERHGNRAAEIGDVMGEMRELAKDTGVPLVVLCQLNRLVEDRGNKDKRPGLADLKGSGNIEEDANTVIFLYRPEYYLQEPEDKDDDMAMGEYFDKKRKVENRIEFLPRKNRGGPSMKDVTLRISMPHSAMWEEVMG